ncbi:MAG TPA: prolyl oligopeptidase family serine peptidase [Clostridia bacterium]|nr:prolyl oligopeptidase family serine peptidase [Clostridia bacterium]
MCKSRLFIAILMVCFMVFNMTVTMAAAQEATGTPEITAETSDQVVVDPGADEPSTANPGTGDPDIIDPGADEPATADPGTGDPVTGDPGADELITTSPGGALFKIIPQPKITVTAESIISNGYITGFIYSGFSDEMMSALSSVTTSDFSITGADSSVTNVEIADNTIKLTVKPFDPANGYNVVYGGALLIGLSFSAADVDVVNPKVMTFILRNENQAFKERTVAVLIDAGKDVESASLNASQFSVYAHNTRKADNTVVAYDGPRTITKVYTSAVNEYGTPSDSGRYIVIEFVNWGEGGENPDGGATSADGYAMTLNYTVTYNGDISLKDGTSVISPEFMQTGIVSPIIDQFQSGTQGTTDYRYFINKDRSEPLPLVIVFHGWGQGNDNECYIQYSNSATVWAEPENQAKHPCHVLAPRNVYGDGTKVDDIMAVVNQWIANGRVDPSRIYVTGYSMGGLSTWTFLNKYPNVAAAAAPLCAVGGPANVDAAKAIADLPIWAFVTEGDGLAGMVTGVRDTYGQYFSNYKLTILKENKVMMDPYNGWVFHPHCVWIPVYNEYVDEERGMLSDWLFAQSRPTLPFTLRNENLPFDERTVAVVIDTGKEVSNSSLDASMFSVNARTTRKVDDSNVVYDGPRTITKLYTSQVNDIGTPAGTGRYIVLEFLNWGEGGGNPDGGAMDANGYTLNPNYTITYNGKTIACSDGTVMSNISFRQTAVISPVLDQYQYGNEDGMDYSYFINKEADGPLPLVIFFHGGGQGNDIYTPIRFSNGGTVWANPENQAKYPCHVLCPRNATSASSMAKVMAVVEKWEKEGLVDPNRIYVTGFSMGGMSTWTFLNTYPDVPAAAVPICAAGAPSSVAVAKSYANLPIWAFVTQKDFLYNMCVNVQKTYGPYFRDYKLTVLEENKVMMEPYNGWVFDPHCCWIPVYNEYTDSEGKMAIDWMFAQNKVYTDLKDELDAFAAEMETGKYTYESIAAAKLVADEVKNAIPGAAISDVPALADRIKAGRAMLVYINQATITAAPNSVLMGSNRSVSFNVSIKNLQKVSVMEGLIGISDSRFEITDISTSYSGENMLFTKNLDYNGDGTTAYFSLAQVDGFKDAAEFDAAKVTITLKSDAKLNNGESLETAIKSIKMFFGKDGEIFSGIVGEGKASTRIWDAGETIGDLDGNDIVNGNDLAIAMTCFGKLEADPDWYTSGTFAVDINSDGRVDMVDLSTIAYLAAHITR